MFAVQRPTLSLLNISAATFRSLPSRINAILASFQLCFMPMAKEEHAEHELIRYNERRFNEFSVSLSYDFIIIVHRRLVLDEKNSWFLFYVWENIHFISG